MRNIEKYTKKIFNKFQKSYLKISGTGLYYGPLRHPENVRKEVVFFRRILAGGHVVSKEKNAVCGTSHLKGERAYASKNTKTCNQNEKPSQSDGDHSDGFGEKT